MKGETNQFFFPDPIILGHPLLRDLFHRSALTFRDTTHQLEKVVGALARNDARLGSQRRN